MEDENTKQNELRDFIEQLEAMDVSYTNAKEVFDKVMAYNIPISSQIKELQAFHNEEKAKMDELLANKTYKDAMEDKQSNVPREIYESVEKMWSYVKQMNTWITLLMKLFRTASTKFANALSRVKDLDIEKEALIRFSDVQKREHEFHEKIIQESIERLEKEFDKLRDEFDIFKDSSVKLRDSVLSNIINEQNKIMKVITDSVEYKKMNSPKFKVEEVKFEEIERKAKNEEFEPTEDVEKYRVKKKIQSNDDSIGE